MPNGESPSQIEEGDTALMSFYLPLLLQNKRQVHVAQLRRQESPHRPLRRIGAIAGNDLPVVTRIRSKRAGIVPGRTSCNQDKKLLQNSQNVLYYMGTTLCLAPHF
jgi:hypothetical protein